jgi:site-specific DNA-methyltransferase (adenine-specific)
MGRRVSSSRKDKILINFHNIDCMEFMKDKPDNCYDLAFTDPPYNVGRKYNTHNDEMTHSDYLCWCDCWFKELTRISETIVMTTGYKNNKYWVNKDPRHIIIWSKPNQNSPSPLGGFNAYEPVFFWGKLQKRVGHDLFVSNIKMQEDAKWHNCPKDLTSWRKLLKMVSEPGINVIDIFGGSMSSAIACDMEGYDLDICEIDKDYFDAGVKRFNEYKAQGQLF